MPLRDQVCDYLSIQLRPLIYIHVKSKLFWNFKIPQPKFFDRRSGSSLVRDWWPQWRSSEQHLQEPVICKLAIKLNKSSSIQLLSSTDRASPGSAACDAAQEWRKSIFLGGRQRPQNMLWCRFLFSIKPIGHAYFTNYSLFLMLYLKT